MFWKIAKCTATTVMWVCIIGTVGVVVYAILSVVGISSTQVAPHYMPFFNR